MSPVRSGIALLGAALAVGLLGPLVLPSRVSSVAAIGLLVAGLALIFRPRDRAGEAERSSRPRPLNPGESYQDAVRFAVVPNVPLAEVWCQRLRQNGIEAFYKSGSPFGGDGVGIADLNPGLAAEIWIGENDVDRTRKLFPELHSGN